jgi:hypothetical protein
MSRTHLIQAAVLAIALGLAAPAGPACACTCLPPDPAAQVDAADVIFVGRVERAARVGEAGGRPISATIFRVERSLKGDVGTWVAVRRQSGDSSLCGMQFDRDREHVVFARRAEGRLYAQACSRDWLPRQRYEAELSRDRQDQASCRARTAACEAQAD